MRLRPSRRLNRVLRAALDGGPVAWVEIGLLCLLAFQVARLTWALLAPVSPLGEWRPREAATLPAATRSALLARFDPFFPGSAAGPDTSTVTSLSLQLFGTRLNEASGLGSAIIATPDGVQTSFAVGDEIVPGARLKSVAADHVVISHNAADESLYLDQSQPLQQVPISGASPMGAPGTAGAPVPVQSQFALVPRLNGDRVTGVAISPRGNGDAFRAAGFQPGDVIVALDGTPIRSVGDLATLQGRLVPGSPIAARIERGGQTVSMTVTVPAP